MTNFAGSPKVLKGAIVGLDVFNLIAPIAISQYNFERVSRGLAPEYLEPTGGAIDAYLAGGQR